MVVLKIVTGMTVMLLMIIFGIKRFRYFPVRSEYMFATKPVRSSVIERGFATIPNAGGFATKQFRSLMEEVSLSKKILEISLQGGFALPVRSSYDSQDP